MNVCMPSFLQRNWKENCKKWMVAYQISHYQMVFCLRWFQLHAYKETPFSVLQRELNKTLASLLSMCFYKIQLNYLLRNPFPDPEITGYYHKDESIIKYSKFPKCVLSFPRLPLQLKTTIWAFSGNTIKKIHLYKECATVLETLG